MMYLWVYNPTRRRHELWARNPADPPGAGRVVAVQGVQGEDHSDLPADVQFTPYGADMLAALASGDPEATGSATTALNMYYQQQGYPMAGAGAQPQQAGAMGALRDTPEQINSVVNRVRTALDARAGQNELEQAEYTLRQKMAEAGYGPQQQEDFFRQMAGGSGEPMPGVEGGQSPAFPGRMPPAYANAYTNVDQQAIRAAQMQRAEGLQQVANAFARHTTGADRLQKYGDALRAREQAVAQYTLDQQRLAADPANDRRLRPVVGGQWVYDQQAGAYDALQGANQSIDQMEQTYWPDVWAAGQQRIRYDREGGHLPEDIRRQLFPRAVPRFDNGGIYYQPPAASSYGPTSSGYQPPQPGGKMNDGFGHIPGMPDDMAEADKQFRQGSFAAGLDQTDISGRIQRAQQAAQVRMGQIDQMHQQRMAGLQQQYGLVQQEVARQMAGLEQQRSVYQQMYGNRALQGTPMSGQTWAG